jgi:hypothetical protein
MTTTDNHLTPQTDEDIEEARWVQPREFLDDENFPMFGNIRELVEACLKMK